MRHLVGPGLRSILAEYVNNYTDIKQAVERAAPPTLLRGGGPIVWERSSTSAVQARVMLLHTNGTPLGVQAPGSCFNCNGSEITPIWDRLAKVYKMGWKCKRCGWRTKRLFFVLNKDYFRVPNRQDVVWHCHPVRSAAIEVEWTKSKAQQEERPSASRTALPYDLAPT